MMKSIYQDRLEGEEEYLWWLQECQQRALSEFIEYTQKIEKQKQLIEKTKQEAVTSCLYKL